MSTSGAVLIVENEPLVREAMADILDSDGFATILALNGHEGIAAYEARRDEIELVILDMRLPGMDGPDILKALRRINPAVKVIVASAYDEREVREGFRGESITSILKKPFGADGLLSSVHKVLSS